MSRSFPRILVCLLIIILHGLPAQSTHAVGSRLSASYSLRILHTNDHHGNLEPLRVNGQTMGGIVRRKTLVDALRAESGARGQPVLLLDAGDVFQGTPYFQQFLGQADLHFYNALGYDAMAIGNHEFDRGDQALSSFIGGARFPVLSANISAAVPSPLAGQIIPWTIVERGGQRIGIFGLTTIHTSWLSAPGPGVRIGDPLASAERAVRELEAEGVTMIIALAHLGLKDELQVLQQVSGIDIMIGGHSHTRLGGDSQIGPYPLIVTRPNGSQAAYGTAWEHGLLLGDMEVNLDAQGNLIQATGQARPVDESIVPDPAFASQLSTFARELQP